MLSWSVMKDVAWFVVGCVVVFGPLVGIAYMLDHYNLAADWVVDIFVFLYVLVVIVAMLTIAMGCQSFGPWRNAR